MATLLKSPIKTISTHPKPSAFQKRWAQVENTKRKNDQLHKTLEKLVTRIHTDIAPVERAMASAGKPLLHKLLALAQRKSLLQWQRAELDEWVVELMSDLHIHSLVDADVLDDVARYDAFRMGVQLQEGIDMSPAQQFEKILRNEQELYASQAEQQERSLMADKKAAQEEAEIYVEKMLDEQLGLRPIPPNSDGEANGDLWQVELEQCQTKQCADYDEARASLRKKLLTEMYEDIDAAFQTDEEIEAKLFEDFAKFEQSFGHGNFDEQKDEYPPPLELGLEKITNATFRRMFRLTAARLHPDREQDPVIRQEKQGLMGNLLAAREQGDLLVILQLYQQYVGGEDTFTKADEKQLMAALDNQIEQLKIARNKIIYQSPEHQMAYEQFYYPTNKRTEQAIISYVRQIKVSQERVTKMTSEIRTLKTLIPRLDDRYYGL